MRFKISAITMELHCNDKNLKSQFSQLFLDQTNLFYKTDWLSLVLLYIWVEFEPIWQFLFAKNYFFKFFVFLPIVITIVKQKKAARVEMTFLNSNILEIG